MARLDYFQTVPEPQQPRPKVIPAGGPQSLFVTASDAITTSDAVARTGTFSRTAADAPSTSDVVTATTAPFRTAADAPTTSDAASRILAALRTAADAVTTSDAAVEAKATSRTAVDTVTVATDVSAGTQRSVADAVTTSDAVVAVRTAHAAASDTITASSAISRLFVGSRTVADHLAVPQSTQVPGTFGNSTVRIYIAGTDYHADILLESARFTSQVNGKPGDGYVRIRDETRSLSFAIGSPVLLTINGDPVWRGFVSMQKRVYIAPALNVTDFGLTRFIDLELVDANVLFQKRYVFSAGDPTNVYGTLYPANTPDKVAIADLVTNFLDLSGDALDTSTYVEEVGQLDPSEPTRPFLAGDSWGAAMSTIAMVPAAVFYLSPDLTKSNLVYTDDDTPSALFGLSDQPDGVTTFGYREMEILHDGANLANDVLAWGFGYGSSTPVFKRAQDATSQSTHGLWQYAQQNDGVYVQGTIDRIATSILDGSPDNHRGQKDDRIAIVVTTFQPGFLPAQKVPFTCNAFGFSGTYPIRKMDVTFANPTAPKYVLTLSYEIDAPWGFVDQFMFSLPNVVFRRPRLPGLVFPKIGSGCDCGITDTFTRTSSSAWGTSDAGIVWNTSGIIASVDGSRGLITADPSTAVAQLIIPPGSMELVATCELGTGTDAGDAVQVGFYSALTSTGLTWNFRRDGSLWMSGYPFNTATGTASFLPTSKHNVRLSVQGTTGQARVWLFGTTEPSTWDLTVSLGAGIASAMRYVQLGITPGNVGPVTAYFDSLDVTDVNRCTEFRFDNFDRTVTGGFGTSDYGVPYTNVINPSGVSVSGGVGTLSSGVSTASRTDVRTDIFAITQITGDRTIRIAFSVDSVSGYSGNPNNYETLFGVTDRGNNTYADIIVRVNGPDAGPLVSMSDSLTNPRAPVSISPNVPYELVFQTNYLTGHYGVKVYPLGSTEPSTWLVETNIAPVADNSPGLELYTFWDGTGDHTATLYWIDFDYTAKPCYSGGPVGGGTPSQTTPDGILCENGIRSSSTIYGTTYAFVPGTTEVHVNGYLMRPGIARDYTENSDFKSITFAVGVASTDVVWICYSVAVSLGGGGSAPKML